MNQTPLNVITVLCDSRTMQTLRITCRCGASWTERVPRELHDSQMIAQFICTKCQRIHLLKNHVLKSISKEELHAIGQANNVDSAFGIRREDDDIQYDA